MLSVERKDRGKAIQRGPSRRGDAIRNHWHGSGDGTGGRADGREGRTRGRLHARARVPFLLVALAASSLSETFGTSLNFFSKTVDSSDAIAYTCAAQRESPR